MTLFTSRREKRLWNAVIVVIIGIYSLIFIGRPLSGYLRERELLTNGFWLAIALVLATVLWHGWKPYSGPLEIGIWLGIIAIYLLVLLRMAVPEERSHLIEYSVLAIFIHEALKERNKQEMLIKYPGLIAIGVSSIIGLLDEGIQLFIPDRVFDLIDIGFNILAAVLGVGASTLLSWVRRKI
ncbi:MAG: VanZ family protein [Flavobacteriaceae bacterium]